MENLLIIAVWCTIWGGERSQIHSKAFSPNSYDVYIVGLGYRDMTPQERMDYYNKKGRAFQQEIEESKLQKV